MSDQITAPALRYHGSKWRLSEWILGQFVEHTCYVEPYAGGASVLLRKELSMHEVYNDLDGDVVNFFKMLRECPDALIQAIEWTPFSREEFEQSWQPADEPLERARRLYIRCWQSFGSGTGKEWRTGWRYCKGNTNGASSLKQWNRIDHLYAIANRLKQVQIESDSALAVIERFDTPDTLFYVDPPYVHSERSKWAGKGYNHEMTDDQHTQLADRLNRIQGMAVVSGYPSDLYKTLYTGWRMITQETLDVLASVQVEALWLSPALIAKRSIPQTMSMFDTLYDLDKE